MNIKKGDVVVLKYPERNTYPRANAHHGIASGALTLGKAYVVSEVCSKDYIIVTNNMSSPWVISPRCFEVAKPKAKRNLPDWF